MKSYKKILLTAAASLIIGTQAFAAEKLRIGTEGAYPPFNLIDASGKVVGFDLDISHALCAKMKVECEVVTSDCPQPAQALRRSGSSQRHLADRS